MNVVLIYGECYKNVEKPGNNIYKMHKNNALVYLLMPFCLRLLQKNDRITVYGNW